MREREVLHISTKNGGIKEGMRGFEGELGRCLPFAT